MRFTLVLFLCFPLTLFGFINRTEILDTMNFARTNPSGFASLIEEKYMNFKRFKWIVDDQMWLTVDGLNAVKEAVSVLQSTTAVNALTAATGLDVMAQVHANYLKYTATLPANPYSGCENNNVGTRVSEVGKWTKIGESIVGRLTTAEQVVVQLLVSDGDATRRHRNNLLNPLFTHVGFGFSNPESVSDLIVIDYAQDFKCNLDVCPKIPNADISYNCTGAGYEFASAFMIKTSITFFAFFAVITFIF